jgi:hypothetical protein
LPEILQSTNFLSSNNIFIRSALICLNITPQLADPDKWT